MAFNPSTSPHLIQFLFPRVPNLTPLVAHALQQHFAPLDVHGIVAEVHAAGEVEGDLGGVGQGPVGVDPEVGGRDAVGGDGDGLGADDVEVGEPDLGRGVAREEPVLAVV